MEYTTGELYHYGVLGMKWGVRRFQRKDGTLTRAGKKRVSNAGRLSFPAYDRKRKKWKEPVKNRIKVNDMRDSDYNKTLESERNRILNDRSALKKSGYKFVSNPDSDVREHNNDIVSKMLLYSHVMKEAERKRVTKYIDRYADATIADLGLENTEKTKEFVKQYLTNSSSYAKRITKTDK